MRAAFRVTSNVGSGGPELMNARFGPRGYGAEQAPAARYLTLAAARAIECNGCGDCCDSRRTDGFWTWGALPFGQYQDLAGGEPVIVPLARVEGSWRDRDWVEDDEDPLGPTRFRCSAFQPQLDGGGRCGLHAAPRPAKCGEYPVWDSDLEETLQAEGEVSLLTSAFPRCSWYGVRVVADDDPRLTA